MADFTVVITKPATNPATTYTNAPQSYAAAAYVDNVEVSSDAVTWSWDFGDGSDPVTDNPAIHPYTSSGNYTVTVTATLVATNDTASTSTGMSCEDTMWGWKIDPPTEWSPIGGGGIGVTGYLLDWAGYHVEAAAVATAEGADWSPPPYATFSEMDCVAGSEFKFEKVGPFPGNPGLLYNAWAQGNFTCSAQAYNQDINGYATAHGHCAAGFGWPADPAFVTGFDDSEYDLGLVGQAVGRTQWGPIGMYNQVAWPSPTTIDFFVLPSTWATTTQWAANCAIGEADITGDVALDDLGPVYP